VKIHAATTLAEPPAPRDKKPAGFKAVIGKLRRPAATEATPVPEQLQPNVLRPAVKQPISVLDVTRATSQIGGLVAAAVGRAIAALGQIAAEAPEVTPVAAPIADLPPPPVLTPLEQAVHDLIEQQQPPDDREVDERPADAPVAPRAPEVAAAPAKIEPPRRPEPVAPLREAPEPIQQAQSHVHLVLDDGPERVVMTVAVRGAEINVALRGEHEATAAALARNAASLDHALRARGLDLASFSADRDPDARRAPQHEPREREPETTERFHLEETA
jgi:hypothetical protein